MWGWVLFSSPPESAWHTVDAQCLSVQWVNEDCENNDKHPESYIRWGTHNGLNTEWRWRFTGAADSHSGGREGLLWERVSPSTAPTASSDPETLARKYMTSLRKLQGTDQLLSDGITQNPISYYLLSSGHPWIPPSWFSVIAPALLYAQGLGVSFLLVAFTS